jgi:hypothetical protein
MKKKILNAVVLLALMLSTNAQNYSIDWYKVAGGGGTSSTGQYIISSTIGQHDAGGPRVGGNYSLIGGFWALNAVQTPGAPQLRLFLTATNSVVVAWPAPSSGFRLQQNSSPGMANWLSVTNAVSVVNGENRVTISPPVGNRFYRLINP